MDPHESKRAPRSGRTWTARRILPLAIAIGGLVAAGAVVAWATTRAPSGPGDFGGPELAVGAGTSAGQYPVASGNVYETSIPIESMGAFVTAEQLSFELQNSAGNRAPFLAVGVIDVSGCWVAYEDGTSSGWAAGPAPSPPPNSTECGSGAGPASDLQAGEQLLILTRASIENAGYAFVIEVPDEGSVTAAIV